MGRLNYTIPGLGAITYIGHVTGFIDVEMPHPDKNEWGMDTLTRTISGAAPLRDGILAALRQGQVYTFNGHPYYLQTWNPDNEVVFPRILLNYKGLIGGALPNPRISGGTVEQSATFSTATPSKATRDIRYITRQSVIRYVRTSVPSGPSYVVDRPFTPQILESVIRDENGKVYFGAAPAGLVTALSRGTMDLSIMTYEPVVGTPYFECQDTAVRLFV